MVPNVTCFPGESYLVEQPGAGWMVEFSSVGPEVPWSTKASVVGRNPSEQWKKPWLFTAYRGLYYPIIWGL